MGEKRNKDNIFLIFYLAFSKREKKKERVRNHISFILFRINRLYDPFLNSKNSLKLILT